MSPLPFGHPSWIEIDLAQFKKNLTLIRGVIGQRKICLPIKSNAYGHGLIPIAIAAEEANIDYLGVSCLQEGALLRQAGVKIPIFVMGAIHEEQIPELLSYNLEFTISSLYKAKLTKEKCLELQQKCRVHVEVDTGMQRTGVRPETAIDLLNYLYSAKCFEVVGLYSHLATSDVPNNPETHEQIRIFRSLIEQEVYAKNRNIICHIASSNGLCFYPESHLDMVRPGILAFGYSVPKNNPILNQIQPFFSVKAKIAYFKVVEANQGISYGHTFKTKERTRIVTIPIGYGDGYRRSLSNRGQVLIRGNLYNIAGTICMDQFMVDVGKHEAYVGEAVTLIGKDGNKEITLEEVAKKCDTISYEILCGFNNRLPRFYKD